MQHSSDGMNKVVLNQIKNALSHNLDERAGQIIESQGWYLSKKDYVSLMTYLFTNAKYPPKLVSYICYRSAYGLEQKLDRLSYIMGQACFTGYADTVRMFLADIRIDPAYSNNSCMRYAYMKGHTEVVRILLEDERVDPIACRNDVIGLCRNGYADILRILLKDKRIDLSIHDNRPLCTASLYGNEDVVRLLLADDRVLQNDMWKAVENARSTGHIVIADMIIGAGAVKRGKRWIDQ